MTAPVAFRKNEIDLVAGWAAKGVRLAMIARPDGSKMIVAAADIDVPPANDDLDARLGEFGSL